MLENKIVSTPIVAKKIVEYNFILKKISLSSKYNYNNMEFLDSKFLFSIHFNKK